MQVDESVANRYDKFMNKKSNIYNKQIYLQSLAISWPFERHSQSFRIRKL